MGYPPNCGRIRETLWSMTTATAQGIVVAKPTLDRVRRDRDLTVRGTAAKAGLPVSTVAMPAAMRDALVALVRGFRFEVTLHVSTGSTDDPEVTDVTTDHPLGFRP